MKLIYLTSFVIRRNPILLTTLPPPLISLATHQLAGRGRTSNTWLSPLGCLQFSALLSIPLSFGPKIVFAQYLAGLAICEALDPIGGVSGVGGDKGGLGVRIKWPNDLYGVWKDPKTGKEERAKLGGVLVNSTYADGGFKLVIGHRNHCHPMSSFSKC